MKSKIVFSIGRLIACCLKESKPLFLVQHLGTTYFWMAKTHQVSLFILYFLSILFYCMTTGLQ